MRRFRVPAAVGGALVFLILTAGPAFAPWKGISDLHLDDGGRVCNDGIEFALAHFFAANQSAEVTSASDPTDVIVPTTQLAQLRFGPVPELFVTGDFYFSSIYRIRLPKVPTGTQLQIHFTGTSNATSGPLTVAACKLGKPVSGFMKLSNPPGVNAVTTTDPVALTFKVPGQTGLDIFSAGEGPTYAPIPCTPAISPNPGYSPTAAEGTLSHGKSSGTYTFLWNPPDPPAELTGCQEVFFRLKGDGLQHRALFDFGT
jgi:hypothetical protein